MACPQPAVCAHFYRVFNEPLPDATLFIDALYLTHYCPFLAEVIASLSSPVLVAEVSAVGKDFGLCKAPGVFGLEVGKL